jgi:hypothetical protein
MLSIGVPPVKVLTLGTSALAALAGTDNDVTPSSSRQSAVHQETEMGEEIHTNDGVCDIGHDEPPREIPT